MNDYVNPTKPNGPYVPDHIYDWLVRDLGFPWDISTQRKPGWMDLNRLAQAQIRFDKKNDTWFPDNTEEDYVGFICQETGWPEP
jgi:hypothetical protein